MLTIFEVEDTKVVLDERVDEPPGLRTSGVDGVLRRPVSVGDRRRRQLVDELVVESGHPKNDVMEGLQDQQRGKKGRRWPKVYRQDFEASKGQGAVI